MASHGVELAANFASAQPASFIEGSLVDQRVEKKKKKSHTYTFIDSLTPVLVSGVDDTICEK